jgi:hypothetical protein
VIEALLLFAGLLGLIRLVQLALLPSKSRITFSMFLRSRYPMTIRDVLMSRRTGAVADVLNPAAARARIADAFDKRVTR